MQIPISELIKANHNAPVDTLLRMIFDQCTEISDLESTHEGEEIRSIDKALRLWYGLDELRLGFTLPTGKRTFVHLIHQYPADQPTIEDISDYGLSLKKIEPFASFLESLDED